MDFVAQNGTTTSQYASQSFLVEKNSNFLFPPPTTKTPHTLFCSMYSSNRMTPMMMVALTTIHPK
jgi:hypothetical protein